MRAKYLKDIAMIKCISIFLTHFLLEQTTALDRLSAYLRERGFRVFTVPEAATMLFSNGVFFSDIAEEDKLINFQEILMSTQIMLEDRFRALAENTDEV